MAAGQDAGFQSLFEEVVKAKRLSTSKMQKLQEVAMKNMENDTQMVSIMFRTHKTLPAASKISSLYAFDALARGARDAIDKKKVEADPNSTTGNCATFLLKLEGILESLVQDLLATNNQEVKDKTRKILDIWTKHQTFPASVLAQLTRLISGTKEKEAPKSRTPPTDPRNPPPPTASTTPPIPPPTTNVATSNVQSALLALLGQAIPAAAPTQKPPSTNNTPPPPVQLDNLQVALLKQLAEQAKLAAQGVSAPPVAAVPKVAAPQLATQPNGVRSPNHVLASGYTNLSPSEDAGNARSSRWNNSDARPAEGSWRGGDRGARGWRGAGRGFRGRGGYESSRDMPPPRPRSSRSRSPPNRPSGVGPRPYSPPNRPSLVTDPRLNSPANKSQPLTDEFGREIRPQSPSVASAAAAKSPEPEPQGSRSHQSHSLENTIAPSNPASSNNSTIPANTAMTSIMSQGLDSMDLTKFDGTDPKAWDQLAQAWKVTYGQLPTQEDLFAYLMSGGMLHPLSMQNMQSPNVGIGGNGFNDNNSNTANQWQANDGSYQPRGRGRGRGFRGSGGVGGRGRGGGFGSNNESWDGGYNSHHGTDAVVLGEGGVSHDSNGYTHESDNNYSDEARITIQQTNSVGQSGNQTNPKPSGGKMIKVGDGWAWQPAS